jgi:hypothetical protein
MDRQTRALIGALVIGIVVGGIAVGAYYLHAAIAPSHPRLPASSLAHGTGTSTQTQSLGPSVPTDWKLYRNDQFGFEIKYPPSWTLEVDIAAAASNFSFTSPLEASGTKSFLVQINPHLDYATLKDAVDAWQPPAFKPISETNLTINGYAAIQVIEPLNQIGSEIFFYENNALYGVPGDPKMLDEPEIASMLSTLRFVPMSSSRASVAHKLKAIL